MSDSPRNQVFISYSRRDKRWMKDLLTHLKPRLRDGTVNAWSDEQIQPGSKWFDEIRLALSQAKVAVLLVTPDFLASDFIHDHELLPLLKDAEKEGLKLLWIPIKASSFEVSPIKEYQAVIDPKKPLAEMKAERDRMWVQICRVIEQAAEPKNIVRERHSLPLVPSNFGQLLRDFELAIKTGSLRDSYLAQVVLVTLRSEDNLQLRQQHDLSVLTTGIQLSDEYFARVRQSAGYRDWQKDFPQTVTPILVGLTQLFDRSADAQALVVQVCNAVAKKLRLRIIWPEEAEVLNDLRNSIYLECINATDLESDEVLLRLRNLKVVGPE